MIYVITPTYSRPTQIPDLTRLSHTLLLIPRLHWILIEDSPSPTSSVSDFLHHLDHYFLTGDDCHRYDLTWTRLHVPTPAMYKLRAKDPAWAKPKGVLQRNLGLKWLRDQSRSGTLDVMNGVVYFADDDNTYDVRLFDEMRDTKRVSVWPVGLSGNMRVEKPMVKEGRVVGFKSWKADRAYAMDMAAFAVNLSLVVEKESAVFSYDVGIGYQESHLLTQLIDGREELEPKASSCSRVYVWHTRTEKPKLTSDKKRTVVASKKKAIEL